LDQHAWEVILERVKAGATLLLSGRFDEDAHFHFSGRQNEIGLEYESGPLSARENIFDWPAGPARLTYSGDATTYLDRAFIPGGSTWTEKRVRKGKVLFAPLPLELNDNLQVIGDVYRYALKDANVVPAYLTTVEDPGVMIAPTQFPHATLYVITSESSQSSDIVFRDQLSQKQFSGRMDPGRAAILLIEEKGNLVAAYNWNR
jgi:hypothetical protein